MLRSTVLTAALVLVATPAAAKPPVDPGDAPTARVRYDDLNLASDAGRQTLDSRVRDAAARLCEDGDVRDLGRVMLADACFRSALESARVQISGVAPGAGTIRIAARPTMLARASR